MPAFPGIVIACSLVALAAACSGNAQVGSSRLIAVFVIDGLRPDSITAEDTPTLAKLRAEGVEYVNSHSVFPTSTRINAASLATGTYPAAHGIVGNSMFVPGVNARAPFDTADHLQLIKLEETDKRAVTTETLGELLRRNGRTLVTASSGTTGNGFLLNPQARHGVGVAIHGLFNRGVTAYPKAVSDAILGRFGTPPPDPDDLGQMQWTDNVVREYVLQELRPDVLIDWMGPLDSAQHANGAGSPQAREALRRIDESLSRTIEKIGAVGRGLDVIITSDHGFARHTDGVNITEALVAAGLKENASSTDVIVASQGQAALFYVAGRDAGRIVALAKFLQTQPWADVVFTRGRNQEEGTVPGTFSLDLIHASHATRAADVAVTLAWSSAPNEFGVQGTSTIHSSTPGPVKGGVSGHGGLSPWVVRNTLLAWGPGFKARAKIDAPASLADLTPTVLALMGISNTHCNRACGRVLREALVDGPAPDTIKTSRRTISTAAGGYRAGVEVSTVGDHHYVDSGSRQR